MRRIFFTCLFLTTLFPLLRAQISFTCYLSYSEDYEDIIVNYTIHNDTDIPVIVPATEIGTSGIWLYASKNADDNLKLIYSDYRIIAGKQYLTIPAHESRGYMIPYDIQNDMKAYNYFEVKLYATCFWEEIKEKGKSKLHFEQQIFRFDKDDISHELPTP